MINLNSHHLPVAGELAHFMCEKCKQRFMLPVLKSRFWEKFRECPECGKSGGVVRDPWVQY